MTVKSRYPSASVMRRMLVTMVLAILTIVAGSLFGIFGLYAISYTGGLIVTGVWAVVLGVLVRYGKLTNPQFSLPLSWGLAALMVVVAASHCWSWSHSDARTAFEQWFEQSAPDASPEQAWQDFMAESLGDPEANGDVLDIFRYKAMAGEWQTHSTTRLQSMRKGIWVWWCWLVQIVLVVVAGTLGVFSGGIAGFDHRRKKPTGVPPVSTTTPVPLEKAGPGAPFYREIDRFSLPGILKILRQGYLKFLLPIIVTVIAAKLNPVPGGEIFIVLFISGFWVSAAMAALEPEHDAGLQIRRHGWHFVNLLAMLAMAVAALFVVGPFSLLLLGLFDYDLTFGLLFAATYSFFLLRLWPIYTSRYLFRGVRDLAPLGEESWGDQVAIAWRLTRTPGAFMRVTLWIAIAILGIVWAYDWVYLSLQTESLRWFWSLFGLVILLPLMHLIVVDRARALRDANDIESLLEPALPGSSAMGEDSFVAPGWDSIRDEPIRTADPEPTPGAQSPMVGGDRKSDGSSNRAGLENAFTDQDSSYSDLHLAAAMEYPEQTRFLLSRGATPDVQDSRGNTPIQVATVCGRLDNVVVLAEAGANLLQLDQADRSLLDIAMIQGHERLMDWLASQSDSD